MTPERWRQIEEYYHAARERMPGTRKTFLDDAGLDAETREQVERLLAQESDRGLLDDSGGDALQDEAIPRGTQRGPYRIESELGAGGMGHVYKALDTRLDRYVALKVSSRQFDDRFRQEARAVAQLNHANICTLFDVGPDYLVMELVDGATLASRIASGPMPQEEVMRIASQMASALDAAHEKGIVHRDLKPANVMIRNDGAVKVLDFGLAKMVAPEVTGSVSIKNSEPGTILGTVSYMSPEQAAGKPVDARSDVYAFGAVVYEMATGKRLHRGNTASEILASVIKDEPDVEDLPKPLSRLLRRCLTKDPTQRLRHLSDAVLLVQEESGEAHPRVASAPSRRTLSLAALAGVAIAGIAVLLWSPWRSEAKLETVRFQIQETEEFQLTEGSVPSVSPDGKWVLLLAKGKDGITRIWLRGMDSVEVRPLAGTETENPSPTAAYWSYDSKSIVWGATSGPYSPGQLKVLELAGGHARVISNIPGSLLGATWNRDGTIVYVAIGGRGLMQVPATGGTPRQITAIQPHQRNHILPQFLPDGRHFLYHSVSDIAPDSAIYIGAIDTEPAQQNMKPVFKTRYQAYFSELAGGQLIYLIDRTLYARPFDWRQGQFTGQPMPITDDVSAAVEAGVGRFAISENGVLAFNTSLSAGYGPIHLLDDSGHSVTDAGDGSWPELSPDGKQVAFSRVDPQTGDQTIWATDIERKVSTRVSFRESLNGYPVWSPDGKYIVFGSMSTGSCRMILARVDGSEPPRELIVSDEPKWPVQWSKNGYLLFGLAKLGNQRDIWIFPHPEQSGSQPVPYLATRFDEAWARFSPDGRWVSYVSSESGSPQIYLRPFSESQLTENQDAPHWQITRTGGQNPRWRNDGKELFFVAPDMRITAMPVNLMKPHEMAAEKKLFSVTSVWYDATGDGTRFVTTNPGRLRKGEAIVVKNWHAALETK